MLQNNYSIIKYAKYKKWPNEMTKCRLISDNALNINSYKKCRKLQLQRHFKLCCINKTNPFKSDQYIFEIAIFFLWWFYWSSCQLYIARLAGRPFQLALSQEMQMQVVDRLGTVRSVVDDHTESLLQTLFLGHFTSDQQQMTFNPNCNISN